MSDPTYCIDTEHRPWESHAICWSASIYRLSDDAWVQSKFSKTEEGALIEASEWIRMQNTQQTGRSVYVDDDGRPVEGHSFTAHPVRGDNVTTTAREDRSDDPAGHSVKAP